MKKKPENSSKETWIMPTTSSVFQKMKLRRKARRKPNRASEQSKKHELARKD